MIRRTLAPLAFALAAIAPATAQFQPAGDAYPLVVNPVSVREGRPEGVEWVRIEQVRAGARLLARLKGFTPVHPLFLDPAGVEAVPRAPMVSWMEFSDETSYLYFEYVDGKLGLGFISYTDILEVPVPRNSVFAGLAWEPYPVYDAEAPPTPREIPLSGDTEYLEETARLLGYNLANLQEQLKIRDEAAFQEYLLPDYADLPTWERLALMNACMLDAFTTDVMGEAAPPPLAMACLVRLQLIHGIMLSSIAQGPSAEHLARAGLFADLLVLANPGHEGVRRLREETAALVGRFSEGTRLGPDWEPLLPETGLLLEFEETALEDATAAYPPIRNLLDYAFRIGSVSARHGRAEAVRSYLLENIDVRIIDKLVLSKKDFSPGASFNANMHATSISDGVFRNSNQPLSAIGLQLILNALGDSQALLPTSEEYTSSFPDLFGSREVTGLQGSMPEDTIAWRELVALHLLKQKLRERGKKLDPAPTYQIEDLFREIEQTYIHFAKARQMRFHSIGASARYQAITRMLEAYGVKGGMLTANLSTQSGYYGWRAAQSRFQEEVEAMEAEAKRLHFTGRSGKAADLLGRHLDKLDSNDNALLELTFAALIAAGRADEAVRRLSRKITSSFPRDRLRLAILAYAPESTEAVHDYLCRKNTGSANDYFCQADAFFRRGEYAKVIEVADAYHYSESPRIALLRGFARWALDGEAPADLQTLRTQWYDEAEGSIGTDRGTLDIWVDIMDEKLGDDPEWLAFRESSGIEQSYRVMRHERALRKPLAVPALQAVHGDLQAITAALQPGDYTLTWHHYALLHEHTALGRILVEETNQFSAGLDPARERVLALMDKTLRIMDGKPGMLRADTMPYPLENAWLHAAVAAGAEIRPLVRFLKSIPHAERYFHNQGVLFLAAMDHMPALVSIFEAIPHEDSDPRWWASPLAIEAEDLMDVALENDYDDLVATIALARLEENDDFSPLARFFVDEAAAAAWIYDNAGDTRQADTWLRQYREAREGDNPPAAIQIDLPPFYTYLSQKARIEIRGG